MFILFQNGKKKYWEKLYIYICIWFKETRLIFNFNDQWGFVLRVSDAEWVSRSGSQMWIGLEKKKQQLKINKVK
jgi:hypothetical protein